MVRSRENKEEKSGADKGDEVNHGEARRGDGAENGDGDAENDTDIEDVTAEDVAEDELGLVLTGGDDSGYELGQRGTEGNDREGDDAFGDADGGGDFLGGVNDEVGADNNASEAEGSKEEREAELPFGFFALVFVA